MKPTTIAIIWISIFLIIGSIYCVYKEDSKETNWQSAVSTYKCSKEQMNKVEYETSWCINNTDYISRYCYGTAILRNCEPNEIFNKNKENQVKE